MVKVHVGGSIWLWQTSKDVVTITDGEDVGVVYGNVVRIGFDPKKPGWLIVEYVPFESDRKFVKPSRVVRIYLNSAEVVDVEDRDGVIARGLADVRTFMENNSNTK